MTLATYSFVPFVRQGLAGALQSPMAGAQRATTRVSLEIEGSGKGAVLTSTVERDVELYGPGDVVGIDTGAIIKTEPRHWITDFEPNYLPYLEFYDEDFPWRYTPAPPEGDRLQPWIALVVLAEDEFISLADRRIPLSVIEVADPDASLPDPAEAWAWAHVHVNDRLTESGAVISTDGAALADSFADILSSNPDLAYARVVSPRKLSPEMVYHAFLVPAFETGRLVGLGLNPADSPSALHAAWREAYPSGTKPEPLNLPVYYQWQFRTAETGDFESLVRLLEPRVADARIGRRDIDVTDPGSNVPGITDPALAGVLRLGGALRVPFDTLSDEDKAAATLYEEWDSPYPVEFQTRLAGLLNLRDAYTQKTASEAHADSGISIDPEEVDDPIVTPPIYGRWHAQVERVLDDATGAPVPNRENWLHELNLDPRHRVTGGFGTTVIQRGQEHYMAAAWEQVGDVLAANRTLRIGQFALQANLNWHGVHLAGTLASVPGQALQVMAPVSRRIVMGGTTAKHTLSASTVSPVLLGSAFRRATRPRGRFLRRLRALERAEPTEDLVTRVGSGEILTVPPKTVPPVLPTPGGLSDDLGAHDAPPTQPRTPALVLGLVALFLLILALLVSGLLAILAIALAVAAAIAAVAIWIRLSGGPTEPPLGANDEAFTPEAVEQLPHSPDFQLSDAGDPFTPTIGGTTDSTEAVRYKEALADLFSDYALATEISAVPDPVPLDVPAFSRDLHLALDPAITIPRKLGSTVLIPDRIQDGMVETFAPVMVYPVFDTPMYEPLTELSSEHFVPNLQRLNQNSITLLEVNQPFIDAYMVGLNHEFGAELLWREYPTDQRGSYFRQFWDVSSYLDTEADPEELKESLRDIPPIHEWPRASVLGDHDHRDRGGEAEDEIVLVVRGELLKRYPNAVIYAQRAEWQLDEDGVIDNTKERRLVELTEVEQANPPSTKLQTPLYEAKVDPDIYFFGFDLTATEARGDLGEEAGDDPGWFFIIKERPGEPRFGLDIDSAGGSRAVWNDLAWTDVLASGAGFLSTDHTFALTEPAADDERYEQWLDDQHIAWTPSVHAGDLAYILYQVPVMVAVHASEMLPAEEA